MSKVCGDSGGKTSRGKPCQSPILMDDGRCRSHPFSIFGTLKKSKAPSRKIYAFLEPYLESAVGFLWNLIKLKSFQVGFVTFCGILYSYYFLFTFNVNIFHYFSLEDFFLAGLRHLPTLAFSSVIAIACALILSVAVLFTGEIINIVRFLAMGVSRVGFYFDKPTTGSPSRPTVRGEFQNLKKTLFVYWRELVDRVKGSKNSFALATIVFLAVSIVPSIILKGAVDAQQIAQSVPQFGQFGSNERTSHCKDIEILNQDQVMQSIHLAVDKTFGENLIVRNWIQSIDWTSSKSDPNPYSPPHWVKLNTISYLRGEKQVTDLLHLSGVSKYQIYYDINCNVTRVFPNSQITEKLVQQAYLGWKSNWIYRKPIADTAPEKVENDTILIFSPDRDTHTVEITSPVYISMNENQRLALHQLFLDNANDEEIGRQDLDRVCTAWYQSSKTQSVVVEDGKLELDSVNYHSVCPNFQTVSSLTEILLDVAATCTAGEEPIQPVKATVRGTASSNIPPENWNGEDVVFGVCSDLFAQAGSRELSREYLGRDEFNLCVANLRALNTAQVINELIGDNKHKLDVKAALWKLDEVAEMESLRNYNDSVSNGGTGNSSIGRRVEIRLDDLAKCESNVRFEKENLAKN